MKTNRSQNRWRTLLISAVTCATSHAATFTVTTTDETGPGSLRQAILDANTNANLDMIAFNIPDAGVHMISITNALPNITAPVIIDGYTQPGSSANTLANGDNPVLLIELSGGGRGINGLVFSGGATNCTVRGLVVNRFGTANIHAAITAWKAHLEHKSAQEEGKRAWYADYQLRVARVERAYGKGGVG